MSLQHLIEQRQDIDNRIKSLHDFESTISNKTRAESIEVQIKLLQRKKDTIKHKIDEKCDHVWGKPDWGYIHCTCCNKMRNTRHG